MRCRWPLCETHSNMWDHFNIVEPIPVCKRHTNIIARPSPINTSHIEFIYQAVWRLIGVKISWNLRGTLFKTESSHFPAIGRQPDSTHATAWSDGHKPTFRKYDLARYHDQTPYRLVDRCPCMTWAVCWILFISKYSKSMCFPNYSCVCMVDVVQIIRYKSNTPYNFVMLIFVNFSRCLVFAISKRDIPKLDLHCHI